MNFAKRYLAGLSLALPMAVGANIALAQDGPLAQGQEKFLGGIYNPAEINNLEKYFNQVVAENAGKWSAITNQTERPSSYNDDWFQADGPNSWSGGLDESFLFAKENGFPYRMHVMVWGNQQPRWIADLPAADQLDAIHEWFDVVSSRYEELGGELGTFEFVEVVNEPINDPPDQPDNNGEGGNYINALGGDGDTGWDWVITSFEMGRTYFPDSQLMLNEFNVLSQSSVLNPYLEIIDLLIERDLIDAVGIQAHAFSTQGSSENIKSHLNQVAAKGLPVYITEMDIDGPDDWTQLKEYRRIFPMFWEHPDVKGVTLWGVQEGSMWRESAYLVREDGSERLAMEWLRCYMQSQESGVPAIFPGQTFEAPANTGPGGRLGGVVDCAAAGSADSWSIVGGEGENYFTIDENGRIALAEGQSLVEGETLTLELVVSSGGEDSEPQTVVIEVGGEADVPPSGETPAPPSSDLPSGGSSGSSNSLFLLMLALLGGMRWMRRR